MFRNKLKLALRTLVLILWALSVGGAGFGLTKTQDIRGGAWDFLNTQPKNPTVHRKTSHAKTQPNKQSNTPPSRANDGDKTESQDKNKVSDEVEDSLALGNSARDAQPPRMADAEKAYKLAVKLNPKDPRPYLGLANIWYDQKHYDESAQMYRQAIELMTSTTYISSAGTVRGNPAQSVALQRGEWRTYLAKSLLQQGHFSEAENELRTAVGENPKNPQSYALLGYSLFQQKKYSEATEALKRAAELAPDNAEYKRLLDESLAHPT